MTSTKKPNIVEKKGINQEILTEIIEDILSSKDDHLFTYSYLCTIHKLKSRRVLRKYIEAARKVFKAPIAGVEGTKDEEGGYKKANDWDGYKQTFYVLVKHAVTTIQTQAAVRKDFARRMNLSLFDQSIFNTEFEDIIRIVDQYQEKK